MTLSSQTRSTPPLTLTQTIEALELIIEGGGLESEAEAELVAHAALYHLHDLADVRAVIAARIAPELGSGEGGAMTIKAQESSRAPLASTLHPMLEERRPDLAESVYNAVELLLRVNGERNYSTEKTWRAWRLITDALVEDLGVDPQELADMIERRWNRS